MEEGATIIKGPILRSNEDISRCLLGRNHVTNYEIGDSWTLDDE